MFFALTGAVLLVESVPFYLGKSVDRRFGAIFGWIGLFRIFVSVCICFAVLEFILNFGRILT